MYPSIVQSSPPLLSNTKTRLSPPKPPFLLPEMAQKTINSSNTSNTNNLGEYITSPAVRVVRPLPRRAQGAHQQYPQGQWHSGMLLSATQNEDAAGPSRLTHTPATPFRGSPFSSQNNDQATVEEHEQFTARPHASSGRRQASSPAVAPLLPESATTSPPRKRLRINLSSFLPKIRKTGIEFLSTQASKNTSTDGHHAYRTDSRHCSDSHSNAQAEKVIPLASHFHNQPIVAIPESRHANNCERYHISPGHLTTVSDIEDEGEIEELQYPPAGEAQRERIDDEGYLENADHRSMDSGSTLDSLLLEGDCDSLFFFLKNGPRTISPEGTPPDSFDVGLGPIPAVEGAIEELSKLGLKTQISDAKLGDGLVNLRLREHRGVLPPHIHPTSPGYPFPLRGFKALLGRTIELDRLETLSHGNGSSSLEVVRSDREPQDGLGFPKGSLWVLKAFRAWQSDLSMQACDCALMQLQRECAAYTRIEEAMCAGEVGYKFIMMAEAVITIWPDPCLVLPLMSTDLAHFIDKSRVKVTRKDSRRILAQTVVGLATLHSIGIIHSDIKPANIFLDAQGNVKIGDFGLSHVTESMESLRVSELYNTARLGTAGYIAPEKVTWIGYSYPVDYWSVGWVLYELVSEKKRLMDALVENDALRDWAVNYHSLEARKNFFKEERLDRDALDLLCGLLDPNPETRMGLKETLLHPFFINDDGSSEFMEMEHKASSRKKEPVSKKWDDFPSRGRYVSEPSDDTKYRWINPYGTYVSDASKLM